MRRPWNITNVAVYSLTTYSSSFKFNMNICTYVSLVNMSPKTYVIAIDYNTLTYQNLIQQCQNVVLQILSKENINIVRHLGKKTGFKFKKNEYLKKNQLIENWNNHVILKNTSAVLELKNSKKIYEFDDHALFCFEIKKSKSWSYNTLHFNDLIHQKIIL